MAERQKIEILQVLRGLAAVVVVCRHAAGSANTFAENIPGTLYAVFELGDFGVDFFFVLSGFIIINSHFSDQKRLSSAKEYGIKRFVRVFVPYWPISIAPSVPT